MARLASLAAEMAVGTDEHLVSRVVENDLVEVGVLGAAQGAVLLPGLNLEGVILEV
jgi:hypothetical protein